mgnify:CR=1 FL=1
MEAVSTNNGSLIPNLLINERWSLGSDVKQGGAKFSGVSEQPITKCLHGLGFVNDLTYIGKAL